MTAGMERAHGGAVSSRDIREDPIAMRTPILAAVALLAAVPSAVAQPTQPTPPPQEPPPQLRQEPQRQLPDRLDPDPDAPQQEGRTIMDWPLPFRDGQILHYWDDQGRLAGFAVRHRLTIDFYDAEGRPLGRAQRVSQIATRYFDQNGLYLGRRLHRKLVTQSDVRPKP
jgi:hypothetical protein